MTGSEILKQDAQKILDAEDGVDVAAAAVNLTIRSLSTLKQHMSPEVRVACDVVHKWLLENCVVHTN